MRTLLAVLSTISVAIQAGSVARSAELGAPPLDKAATTAKYEDLFAQFPVGFSQATELKQIELLPQILSLPSELAIYLESLFDPAVDELFQTQPPAPERAAVLTKSRDTVLMLLAQMDAWFAIRRLQRAMDQLALDKQREVSRFLDEVCARVRPEVFRRALAVHPMNDWMLGQSVSFGDVRLIGPLHDYCVKKGIEDNGQVWELRRLLAGQAELMRQRVSHERMDTWAADYLCRLGEDAYVAACALAELNARPDNGGAAAVLSRADSPEARNRVVELLEDEATPEGVRRALLEYPRFAAEERAMLVLSDRMKLWLLRREDVKWFREHNSKAAVEIAKAEYAAGRSRDEAEEYLLWAGDPPTVERVLRQVAEPDPAVILHVLEGGSGDKLPESVDAAFAATNPAAVWVFRYAEHRRGPKVIEMLQRVAQNPEEEFQALILLVRQGDLERIPRLKELATVRRASLRADAAAVLYTRGQVDQFNDLVWIMKTQGLHLPARLVAAKSLGLGPPQMKRKAAEALTDALLDPYGDISETAYGALMQLHGGTGFPFSPWAEDAVRAKQAKAWKEWAHSIVQPDRSHPPSSARE